MSDPDPASSAPPSPPPPPAPPPLPPPHQSGAAQTLYLWLSAFFVTALLLANITGVKLFRLELDVLGRTVPVDHTAGMLSFPITFLLTDLLNEFYGRRGARRVVCIAFVMGAVAFGLIWISRQLPVLEAPGTATYEAYENIFGAAALMYIASLAAFLIGSMLDIFLFGVFKRTTGNRLIWLRATGSTVISQLFDSLLVAVLFFTVLQGFTGGTAMGMAEAAQIGMTGYVLKFVLAVALTPLIYLGRWMIREYVGLQPLPPSE